MGNDIANIEAVRFQLKTQFDRNVVTHFEAQEQIFDYIFSHLGIDTEGRVDHPVVLTEAFLNPNYSRMCKLNSILIYSTFDLSIDFDEIKEIILCNVLLMLCR